MPEPAAVFTHCVERLTADERIAFVETMDGLAEGLRTRLHGGAGKRASRAFDALRRTDPAVIAWLETGGKSALRRWAVAGGWRCAAPSPDAGAGLRRLTPAPDSSRGQIGGPGAELTAESTGSALSSARQVAI